MSARAIVVDYTNYRGERALRRIVVRSAYFGSFMPYHKEPQWLLVVWDLDKQAERIYAQSGIHSWDGLLVGDWRKIAERAGVCMTCAVQPPEPIGCTDCLNTGWAHGSPEGFSPDEKSWSCSARAGSDDQACSWPICSCDPVASRVVEALQASGCLKQAEVKGVEL